MPRYHFNLHECGTVFADQEGQDLPGEADAHRAAVAAARDVMSAEVRQGRLCLGCRVDVMDDAGRPILSLPFREAIALSGV